jgi:hypothetical protein
MTGTLTGRGNHWGQRYFVNGYIVATDLELPALPPLGHDACRAPDLTLRRGRERRVPHDPLPGHELARLSDAGRHVHYSMARHRGRFRFRFGGACEFDADLGLTEITYHVDPDSDPGLAAILTCTLLAARLLIDGRMSLHASAVVVDGAAVAFVGGSGMGKSTLSAIACAGSAALLTDDLLYVSDPSGSALAWPGATECRLRPGAATVSALYPGEHRVNATADGRTALAPPRPAAVPVPLAACVIPVPGRATDRLEVRRLDPFNAVLALTRFPRVSGWHDAVTIARQFQLLGDLAERVPVYAALVPWTVPFRADVVEELLHQVLEQRAPVG